MPKCYHIWFEHNEYPSHYCGECGYTYPGNYNHLDRVEYVGWRFRCKPVAGFTLPDQDPAVVVDDRASYTSRLMRLIKDCFG